MTYDATDPRVQLLLGALQEVLANADGDKAADYFTPDAVVQINTKVLNGLDEIKARLAWIKQNVQHPNITVKSVFFDGQRGFDHHTARFHNDDGELVELKIFGYIELLDGKIRRYEDLTVQVAGPESMAAATSTTAD